MGEIIGAVGHSGNSLALHVHFEVLGGPDRSRRVSCLSRARLRTVVRPNGAHRS
jgi:murein DD-endopeptidase MepM/ murein hydrolase activator NlpD